MHLRKVCAHRGTKCYLKYDLICDTGPVLHYFPMYSTLMRQGFCTLVLSLYFCLCSCFNMSFSSQVCCVDSQVNGHYPGHMFIVMVIHFLQQIGVLPILHQVGSTCMSPMVLCDPAVFLLQGYMLSESQ